MGGNYLAVKKKLNVFFMYCFKNKTCIYFVIKKTVKFSQEQLSKMLFFVIDIVFDFKKKYLYSFCDFLKNYLSLEIIKNQAYIKTKYSTFKLSNCF